MLGLHILTHSFNTSQVIHTISLFQFIYQYNSLMNFFFWSQLIATRLLQHYGFEIRRKAKQNKTKSSMLLIRHISIWTDPSRLCFILIPFLISFVSHLNSILFQFIRGSFWFVACKLCRNFHRSELSRLYRLFNWIVIFCCRIYPKGGFFFLPRTCFQLVYFYFVSSHSI